MRLRIRPGTAPWVLVLLCVTACGTSEPAPSWVDTQTITWYANTSVGENPFAILVEDFERTHPTIRVTVVSLPDDTDVKRTMIKAAIESGIDAPDVYFGDVIWPAEFGADHLALRLDDVFRDEIWKRFPPELVHAATYAGAKYAVPFHSDQGLLYYRKDLVKPEEVPRTWEDLAAMARELQEREDLDFDHGFVWQGKQYEGLTCNWLEMVSAAGGQVLDNEGVKSRMTSPESARALRFMRQLIADRVTPPEVTHFAEPDSSKLFASGKAAFMRGWSGAYTGIKKRLGQEADSKIGVASLPTFAGQPYPGPSTVGGWSLFINPNTKKLGAVKEFVDWLTDAPAQRIVARYSLIPTNRDVRSDENVMDANPAVKVVLASATRAEGPRLVTRPSNTPVYPDLSKAIYVNIHRALADEATPLQQALADADSEINTILDRLPISSRPIRQPGSK
jgi:trehalose/maltose transport system substrate-binding protein